MCVHVSVGGLTTAVPSGLTHTSSCFSPFAPSRGRLAAGCHVVCRMISLNQGLERNSSCISNKTINLSTQRERGGFVLDVKRS